MLRFSIDISDVDRGVYQTLELRVARHPSEGDHYLVTRIIAAALHVSDGVEMSRAGLCGPEDPPLIARDLTGQITHWIDLGAPSPERLHKANKKAQNVVVYTYKRPEPLIEAIRKASVHRAEDIALYSLRPEFLDSLAACIGRNNAWTIVRTEGELFITAGDLNATCDLVHHPLGDGA
jgi:uncharacterized protein YaeQ